MKAPQLAQWFPAGLPEFWDGFSSSDDITELGLNK
jgi:hypothetical protein